MGCDLRSVYNLSARTGTLLESQTGLAWAGTGWPQIQAMWPQGEQSRARRASRMSRYPSAYGHTPSYKSVGGLGGSSYPSALGSSLGSSTGSSSLTRDMDREMGAMRREMDKDLSGVLSVSFVSQFTVTL